MIPDSWYGMYCLRLSTNHCQFVGSNSRTVPKIPKIPCFPSMDPGPCVTMRSLTINKPRYRQVPTRTLFLLNIDHESKDFISIKDNERFWPAFCNLHDIDMGGKKLVRKIKTAKAKRRYLNHLRIPQM